MKKCNNQAFKDGRLAGLDRTKKPRKLAATAKGKAVAEYVEYGRGFAVGRATLPVGKPKRHRPTRTAV